MTPSVPAARFRWWHGAAILVAANAVSFWPAGVLGDAAFYTSFRLPPTPHRTGCWPPCGWC